MNGSALTTNDDSNGITYVHVARRLAYSGSALTLLDLSPATVFVTGSSAVLGYLTTGMFLDRWYCDCSGSSTRVVAAVLSVLDPAHTPVADTHLQVCLPRIRSAGLEYQVAPSEADVLPSVAGACVLFVNPAQVPLTPRLAGSTPGSTAGSTSSVEAICHRAMRS